MFQNLHVYIVRGTCFRTNDFYRLKKVFYHGFLVFKSSENQSMYLCIPVCIGLWSYRYKQFDNTITSYVIWNIEVGYSWKIVAMEAILVEPNFATKSAEHDFGRLLSNHFYINLLWLYQ